jgi:hypothetical protein
MRITDAIVRPHELLAEYGHLRLGTGPSEEATVIEVIPVLPPVTVVLESDYFAGMFQGEWIDNQAELHPAPRGFQGGREEGRGAEEVAGLRRQSSPVRVAKLPESRARPGRRSAGRFRQFCDEDRGRRRKGGRRS